MLKVLLTTLLGAVVVGLIFGLPILLVYVLNIYNVLLIFAGFLAGCGFLLMSWAFGSMILDSAWYHNRFIYKGDHGWRG